MMSVLILPGGRAESWAVRYQGWWPRVDLPYLSLIPYPFWHKRWKSAFD